MNSDLESNIELVREISAFGFREGLDCLACIEILEKGNEPEIVAGINSSDAVDAVKLVRNSLFTRLQIMLMRAYDPVRNGDKHLGVAFKLLEDEAVFNEIANRGNWEKLEEASENWKSANSDPRLELLRHNRNKFLVHLSQPKKGIQTPIINELLGFTLATTEIWENLANGTAVMATSLALQLGTYTESAEAFWKPWKS